MDCVQSTCTWDNAVSFGCRGESVRRGNSNMRLKGKIAIVTGGSQGIGEAVAKRYAAEGAKVAILNRNEAKAPHRH